MSKTWFTADTHFNHQRTLELSKRPYKNIDEMNWDIVKKWNSVVNDEDVVYHLGDFGDLSFSKLLKGKIILLFGNYEYDQLGDYDSTKNMMDSGNFFDYSLDDEVIATFNGDDYSLVHEPGNANPHRFKLFGHIHKLQMVKRNGLNIGVDCHNFYPVDLETVEFYRNAILNHYDEDVFGE